MASLITRISDLATRMGSQCKALKTLINGNATDLSSLTTTDKSNLVNAANELMGLIHQNATAAASKAAIDDSSTNSATSTTTTYSAKKINDSITAALNALTSGAPGALDTLKELADAIGDDANFAGTVTNGLANRLRFDTAQTLTVAQQTQGQANLNVLSATAIGNPDTDFVAVFNSALTS